MSLYAELRLSTHIECGGRSAKMGLDVIFNEA